jgi:hypothetical protein
VCQRVPGLPTLGGQIGGHRVRGIGSPSNAPDPEFVKRCRSHTLWGDDWAPCRCAPGGFSGPSL